MVPALDLAAAIIRDLRDLQPQAWVLWQAVENEQYCVWWKYNHGPLHGDFMHDTEAMQVTRKYHAMAQFTRFVRPGYRMIGVLAEDTVAFLDPRGSRLVLVYSSPVLPRGDHVLTVRVTGDKAAAARHVVVTAARADISP
jgi:O-glycosyl hydrolase